MNLKTFNCTGHVVYVSNNTSTTFPKRKMEESWTFTCTTIPS